MSTVETQTETETPAMPAVETPASPRLEMQRILESIRRWPVTERVSLARRILETVENISPQHPVGDSPGLRGRPVEELIGLLAGDKPPPSDAEVKQWIDEHRMEKYGP